jgi:hypothetical protein
MNTLTKTLGILTLVFFVACSSTPQARTDGIEEMASLVGSDGEIETTLEIQSVDSSTLQAQAETRHLSFKATYKGKTVQGVMAALEGVIHAVVGQKNPALNSNESRVSAALAAGDRVKIRGRIRSIKGVPTFIGLKPSETVGVTATAATASAAVILLGEGKTLPGPKGTSIIPINDLEVSFVFHTIDWTFMTIQTASGTGVFRASTAGSGLEVGKSNTGRMNGQLETIQTPLGPIGKVTGILTYGQNKTVEVQGFTEVSGLDVETESIGAANGDRFLTQTRLQNSGGF